MKQLIISLSDFIKEDAVEREVDRFEGDIGCLCEVSVCIRAVKISDSKACISGSVSGFLFLNCSRCLAQYRHPIDIKFSSDMDFFGAIIDVSEEVRQLLVLEMPMKPLCSPACAGICPICGKRNKEDDSCSCQNADKENLTKERWKELFSAKRVRHN
ncbi:MAG: DUF177 domain-containing protein [Endomicrobium sp.]|nr:DUF177 domain-containing protein [Endomicrobium sp.]